MITKVISINHKGHKVKLEIRPDSQDEFMARDEVFNGYYFRYGQLEIKPGDTVFDLGANVGSFSILAGIEGAKKIVAVEPLPDSIALLERNIKANESLFSDPVTIFRGAVMGENKEGASLFLNKDPFGTGSHTLVLDDKYSPTGFQSIPVKTVSLDQLMEETKTDVIDFLKCDIEGAEYEVIENCKNISKIRQLSFEWHHGPIKFARLLTFLVTHGFAVAWFEGDNNRGKLQVKSENNQI